MRRLNFGGFAGVRAGQRHGSARVFLWDPVSGARYYETVPVDQLVYDVVPVAHQRVQVQALRAYDAMMRQRAQVVEHVARWGEHERQDPTPFFAHRYAADREAAAWNRAQDEYDRGPRPGEHYEAPYWDA